MLQWMIFSDQLAPYFTAGEIKSMVRAYEMFYSKEGFDHDFTTEQRKQWIEDNFEPEIAAKLFTQDRLDLIEEYRVVWTVDDEPRKMGAGYLVYSQDIDWDAGTVNVELSQPLGSLEEHLFWDAEEHLSSEYEAAHFEVTLSGLCFEQEAIEMLLPSHSLENFGALMVNAIDRPSTKPALGRPPKWDWEGAISNFVSVAQHPDGLPVGEGAQARIEEMMSQWFHAAKPSGSLQWWPRLYAVFSESEFANIAAVSSLWTARRNLPYIQVAGYGWNWAVRRLSGLARNLAKRSRVALR